MLDMDDEYQGNVEVLYMYNHAPILCDKRIARFSQDNKYVDAEIHHKYTYGGQVASCTRKKTKKKKRKKSSLPCVFGIFRC
ncbi:hypothetical protein V6N12_043883 [Hibiscus sabdariffa]|uniref:Uncharacterized protein n=1 Tax=Hibiscus sabdariffa TaxID=183260 RepID=A0ABR2DFN4_9ROSI